jgi:uncharacterized linocin/CFP29 family protein
MAFKFSRVGIDTGEITDEQKIYIDKKVIQAARKALVARQLFPVETLPNVGVKTWRTQTLTDMSQAVIDMDGKSGSEDRIELTPGDVAVPVIHKSFRLGWREIAASRDGTPLETLAPENAAIQVAEEEDKLLLSGEYTGWRCFGIEGLSTVTGRNSQASAGAWPANSITDVGAAKAKLREDKHYGPYVLVCTSVFYGKLEALISSTGVLYLEKMREIVDKILVSDMLYASDGGVDSALIVEPGPDNLALGIAQDATTFLQQLKDMDTYGKVYEVLTPKIKRPTCVCEITGLT